MGAVSLLQFHSWAAEKHWFSLAPCPCHYSRCWSQPKPFPTTANGFKEFSRTCDRILISRFYEFWVQEQERQNAAGRPENTVKSINKTILCYYCKVGITSVLRCWNEIKGTERSAFLMKLVAIAIIVNWLKKHFICLKSCFLPVNCQN